MFVCCCAAEPKASRVTLRDIGGSHKEVATPVEPAAAAESRAGWADMAGSLGERPHIGVLGITILFRSRTQVWHLHACLFVC